MVNYKLLYSCPGCGNVIDRDKNAAIKFVILDIYQFFRKTYKYRRTYGKSLFMLGALVSSRRKPPLQTIDEVKRILDKDGFRLQSVRGSHHVFVHKDLEYTICIPTVNGRTVKPGYVRAIRSALQEIEH